MLLHETYLYCYDTWDQYKHFLWSAFGKDSPIFSANFIFTSFTDAVYLRATFIKTLICLDAFLRGLFMTMWSMY